MRNLLESFVEVDLLISMDYFNRIIISSNMIMHNLALSHSHLGLIISGNSPDSMGSQTGDMTTSVVWVLFAESLSQLTLLEKGDQLWNLENNGTKEQVPMMKVGSSYKVSKVLMSSPLTQQAAISQITAVPIQEVTLEHAITPSPINMTLITKPLTKVVHCLFTPKMLQKVSFSKVRFRPKKPLFSKESLLLRDKRPGMSPF